MQIDGWIHRSNIYEYNIYAYLLARTMAPDGGSLVAGSPSELHFKYYYYYYYYYTHTHMYTPNRG